MNIALTRLTCLAALAALALSAACTDLDDAAKEPVAPEACLAPPADWVGDWGERPGVYANCGGKAGACIFHRTEGSVAFTVRQTGVLVRGGKAEKICVRKTDAIYGGNEWFASDAFRGLVVGVRGDTMTQADNAYDGFSSSLQRLTGDAPPSRIPAWFARDWRVTSGGTRCESGCFLRVGANDMWAALVGEDRQRRTDFGAVGAVAAIDGTTFQLEFKAGQIGHGGVYSLARDGDNVRLTGPAMRPWTKGRDRPAAVAYTLEPGAPPATRR